MNLAYNAYHLLGRLLYPVLYPAFTILSTVTGGPRENAGQRFGNYPKALIESISGAPRIWIHAASVGEIGVAESIIPALRASVPDAAILVSTITEQGQAYARARLGPEITCVYAPLDLPVAVTKSLDMIRPDILVCLETEIWPNWLITAHNMGIRTAMVNGRISVRSIKKYMKIRPLIKETLARIDTFSMIQASDAARIRRLGAPKNRIAVNGNAKYDRLLDQADPALRVKMASRFNLKGDEPVLLAGSTRDPEEKTILDVYDKIRQSVPETLLIIAPRHISRTAEIENLVREKGFEYQLRTDLDKTGVRRTSSVVIINTIGELQAIYSIGSLVFCGGSLAPLGGQNVLEPAVWGKPVLYGSSMEDFLDAKALLERTGGGIQIADPQDLYEKALYYLSNPSAAERMGEKAREAAISCGGAARKHADAILNFM